MAQRWLRCRMQGRGWVGRKQGGRRRSGDRTLGKTALSTGKMACPGMLDGTEWLVSVWTLVEATPGGVGQVGVHSPWPHGLGFPRLCQVMI